MSRFYGRLHGVAKNPPTARGHHDLKSETAGWKGCINTRVWHQDGTDYYEVLLTPWGDSTGPTTVLAHGVLDAQVTAE